MELGTGPTLEEAIEAIFRVAKRVGGDFAKKWALELKLIGERLAERSQWGPKHVGWRTESARIMLAATVGQYNYERREGLAGAKALAEKLPALERKAVSDADVLSVAAVRLDLEALIGEEVEQIELNPRTGKAASGLLEGKGLAGWSPEKEHDLTRFIRRIGGYVADGGQGGSPLDFDTQHFSRAQDLILGDATPDSDSERRELERWRAKYPPGASP